ncbi:MAG: alpha-N-arabinofuranosidase [Acidimicrobiales bacterium]|nr:alpha-N-arabinofuranosidase [Acidimicrobiales bacterium]
MTLRPTNLFIEVDQKIAEVDPRVFGGFLEHMGRAIYEGVYDPTSRLADDAGCRTDVLEALRKLKMTAMRYPGGNFVSGYNWRDGVGPKGERPTRFDRAWFSKETNMFGTDEFLALSERMGWTPMMAVNLGNGSPTEAAALVSYCNSSQGSEMGDWRASNGHPAPYGISLWCLGNEMDGIWQIGHLNAKKYVEKAKEATRLMREVDPDIELVVCGSSDPMLPTYPAWDRSVLSGLGDEMNYLSVHRYARNFRRDTPQFLAFGLAVDKQIEELNRICLEVQHQSETGHRSFLSFDEWNVWYRHLSPFGWGQRAPHLLEETYNVEDALVVAGFLNSFIRHADVVKIANLSQAVNVVAPIRTRGDDILIQSIYYAFEMFSSRSEGEALKVSTDGPRYQTRKLGMATFADTSAILGDGVIHLFIVNRSVDESMALEIELQGATILNVLSADCLTGPSPKAKNTFARPNLVRSTSFDGFSVSSGSADATLPPLSLVAVSLSIVKAP